MNADEFHNGRWKEGNNGPIIVCIVVEVEMIRVY